jgi:hypothetical protein
MTKSSFATACSTFVPAIGVVRGVACSVWGIKKFGTLHEHQKELPRYGYYLHIEIENSAGSRKLSA